MDDLINLFPDAADALGIESVAIVEKDYYIVELLRLLQPLAFNTHQLVFSGGTALSKAGISLNRMSEDVDIKLVPVARFYEQYSRTQRKNIRRNIVQNISELINASATFSLDAAYPKITRDEFRYNEIPVRYPQVYLQSPCLRPFIKLELIETELLEPAENRDISSLIMDLTNKGQKVDAFPSATITSTQAEKLIAMLRRSAANKRHVERTVDESLVRHIYDNFCIIREKGADIPALKRFVQACIEQDIARYGAQYPEFCKSPVEELILGLEELASNPVYQERYLQFVTPMIFGNRYVPWEDAYTCFRQTALDILAA